MGKGDHTRKGTAPLLFFYIKIIYTFSYYLKVPNIEL